MLVFFAVTVVACSAEPGDPPTSAEPPSTTVTVADPPSTTTSPGESAEVSALAELSSTTISVDDRTLAVAVADTPEVRRQGLKGVKDLGGFDGMLFVWEADTGAAFWMQDTLIPLDIAFFGVGGSLVDRLRMEPCTTDECPLYSAAGLYRFAVEAPAADLDFMTPESVLVLEGGG